MPAFKEDHILVIAPGSRTTLAQLGIPESLTPATHHIRSCMFPAEKEGQYEPRRIRRKQKHSSAKEPTNEPTEKSSFRDGDVDDIEYEEDALSEAGAIWPIVKGEIVDWPAFYALMSHVHHTIHPPFHTPILLIAEPVWTPRDHEKLTQFFFEKFKIPAFVIMDAAMATSYAYRLPNATIVDVGLDKADVTAISDHLVHTTGRTLALPDCGGSTMTDTLVRRLAGSNFSREMCEQLKQSPICEVLLPTDELPNSNTKDTNPAAAASTAANGPTTVKTAPEEPPPDGTTALGEDNEGVLDIASIVTSGNMGKFLEQKEREKAEKMAVKAAKKAGEAATSAPKAVKLVNSKRAKNTFLFQDHALETALKDMDAGDQGMTDMQNAITDGNNTAHAENGRMSREIEVGLERFEAASDGILDRLADAIHRTISAVDNIPRRNDLWNAIVVVGNGSKIRGFKEALIAHLQAKYLISPSSATMFTSEIPSNMSTPIATGMNTPQPQHMLAPGSLPHGGGAGVNPMLLAATTGGQQAPPYTGSPAAPSSTAAGSVHIPSSSTSHSQTPTSIDVAKIPEYFPEWKDFGYEEAMFLGAQVAVKVIFSGGDSKSYMTRSDYNEQGPQAIHDYSLL